MIINGGCTYTTASGTVVDYSEDIRYTDEHRHKYGSALAEYLDRCDGADEWTGSTEWSEYVQRFGKRLLFSDDRGFVWVGLYQNEAEAKARFDEIDAAYGEWLDSEDSE